MSKQKRADKKCQKALKKQERLELKQAQKQAKLDAKAQAVEKTKVWREKSEKRRQFENAMLKIANEQKPTKAFLPLDNAALIFPASENKDKSNMFRLSVLMRETVDPVALQYAVNDVVPRFPNITGSLKKGAFWYYIEPSYKPITVSEQTDFPCRKLGADARSALFRVLFKNKEIAVEIFHPATDGTGALTFFNSLIRAYLLRRGVKTVGVNNAPSHLDRPRPEEMEDSYQRLYQKDSVKQNVDVQAYRIKGEPLMASMLLVTTGTMSGSELNAIAKKNGMTTGQLLATTLIWAIEKDREFRMDADKRIIVVAMPVNLRKMFPSQSLRNFVGQIPLFGTGNTDFDQIAAGVKAQMDRLITKEYFTGFTTYNLKLQRNPLFKIIPRFIKTACMKVALRLKADNVMTMSFSNMGRIETPEEFKDHILRYDFVLGPHKKTNVSLTAVCFGDVCSINMGRSIKETNVARNFFTKLAELGANIAVESNYEVDE